MTVVCAVAHRLGQLIAADHRWSGPGATRGDIPWTDYGGKMPHVADGTWVAFGSDGGGAALAPVLERLATVRGYGEAWDVLRDAAATLPSTDYTHILVSGPDGVGRVAPGGVHEPRRNVVYVSLPKGLSMPEETAAFNDALRSAQTVGDVVRTVAHFFARVAELSPGTVSPTMELVYGRRGVTGPARIIAQLVDEQFEAVAEGHVLNLSPRSPA
jgi:hypothetical protein